jgi:hypothetical protein
MEVGMLSRQVSDVACFFADLDCINPDDWAVVYAGYQGLIDLVEGKYLRVNGRGQIYEFGDPNAPDGPIDWSKWYK